MANKPSEILSKERSDLSNFLIHLTKKGSFEDYRPYLKLPGHWEFDHTQNVEAEDSLKKIISLNPGKLLARAPFGHFKYGISVYSKPRKRIPIEWLKCVCFSEAPLSELKSFYEATQAPENKGLKMNEYKNFGLAFYAELIRSKKGHPVIYFDSKRKDILTAVNQLSEPHIKPLMEPILPLFESFGPPPNATSAIAPKEIDFRWEREWRIVGDFEFKWNEVAFGLCPESKINEFEKLVNSEFPFIDPSWDIEKIRESFLAKGLKDLAEAI